MKSLKLTIVAAILTASSFFITSCGSKEKEVNVLADSLTTVNGELSGKLTEIEAAVQEFVNAFNEIQDNLTAIKEKEKIVSTQNQSGDVKSKEESIKEDIQSIYDLLAKNKDRIGSLSDKLKKSKSKIAGLEQMITTLQAQIDSKDGEIGALKASLEAKNIELSNIVMNLETVEQESSAKTEKLNTAFYAIGTKKELIERGVITKEGGFIGIGKTAKIKDNFNKNYFTKIDVSNTTFINIAAKKAKIVSNHPSNSYKLIGEKTIEKIEITNSEDFWASSKYLVIVIE